MSRVVKLIFVSNQNNNKFYHMTENTDNTFTVKYGRVGAKGITEIYPLNKWDTKYKEKIKKKYKDVTDLYVEDNNTITQTENKVTKVINKNKHSLLVNEIVNKLQTWAKISVAENYTVKVTDVTQKQVDTAQELLNKIIKTNLTKKNITEFNKLLLEFYTIIPRKMKHTSLHLVDDAEVDLKVRKDGIVQVEQDTLDVMSGQVKLKQQEKENGVPSDTKEEDKDILSISGINVIEELDTKVIAEIKKMMADDYIKLKHIYKVVNNKTQKNFNEHLDNAKNKATQLFWHGSRNENWWNIINTGLLIRPSGAVHSGSMFSDGCYFASKFRKSYGYTSGRNSYYAKGNSNECVLAIYNVHIGEQKHIKKHTSDCYKLSYNSIQKEGYDSVYAHGGVDLVNDEFIIYNINQSTIKYLIVVNA